VESILHSLELNSTVFIQLGIFASFYLLAKALFFNKVSDLMQVRHKRTVEDRAQAEKMADAASAKQAEYKARLDAERVAARRDYDLKLEEVRREEARVISAARGEAKEINQRAVEALHKQGEGLRAQLSLEVESFAQGIANQLLTRRG
jgi:F0F1-type ATP synthase membrane subunit b/b'